MKQENLRIREDGVVYTTDHIKLFKAPCNITTKDGLEFNARGILITVRYPCGRIKWKRGRK